MKAQRVSGLLGPHDPEPVELVNPTSAADVLLVCEHAGRAVPSKLNGLGVSGDVLDSHRGWDIGAEAVARRLADHLKAPLVLQRYSRLVIDANRPPCSAESMPAISHGVEIPANRGIDPADKAARVSEILDPMDHAIEELFQRCTRRAAFSVHSFTPELNGHHRPWRAGLLTRRSTQTAETLRAGLLREDPDLTIALNEPYQIEDDGDWFIPHHVEPRGLPHTLIEIRNDEIEDDVGATRWAGFLAAAITDVLEELR